jgi:hypothetical protein
MIEENHEIFSQDRNRILRDYKSKAVLHSRGTTSENKRERAQGVITACVNRTDVIAQA